VLFFPYSTLQKIQHCVWKYNSVGHVYNIFESLKVVKTNNLLTRNAKVLPHSCNVHSDVGLEPSTALGFALYCISLSPTPSCYFFCIPLAAVLQLIQGNPQIEKEGLWGFNLLYVSVIRLLYISANMILRSSAWGNNHFIRRNELYYYITIEVLWQTNCLIENIIFSQSMNLTSLSHHALNIMILLHHH